APPSVTTAPRQGFRSRRTRPGFPGFQRSRSAPRHRRMAGTLSVMKILFVTHSLKLGGAERSLRELIRNLDGVVCDLVVPWWSRLSDDEIHAMFGPSLRRVERAWLPFDLCYRGRPPRYRAIHR